MGMSLTRLSRLLTNLGVPASVNFWLPRIVTRVSALYDWMASHDVQRKTATFRDAYSRN